MNVIDPSDFTEPFSFSYISQTNAFLMAIDLDPTSSSHNGFRVHVTQPERLQGPRAIMSTGVLRGCSCLQSNADGILMAVSAVQEMEGQQIRLRDEGGEMRPLDMIWLDFDEIASRLRLGVRLDEDEWEDIEGE